MTNVLLHAIVKMASATELPSFFPECVPAHVRKAAIELGVSEEHALAFSSAISTWRARVEQRVSFDYESLGKNKSQRMGRVATVVLYGTEPRGDGMEEEQSVVVKIEGGGGSYRVWPEDRMHNLQILPSTHPTARLIKDISFGRCGKDGEMRLALRHGAFEKRGNKWNFDMEASFLLYVFPTEVAAVVRSCPSAFPSLAYERRVLGRTLSIQAIPSEEPEREP